MNPTRTFGAWLFDVRIGRTTNWPGLVRRSPDRPSVLAEERSPWGGPTVEKAADLVRCRGAGVLLRNDGDRAGGPIKYSARNRADPAGPFPAAVGAADDQQLHVSRH